MDKFFNFIKINKKFIILFSICTILFLIPSFWGSKDAYNIGGDDTRLYVYSPFEWFNNITKYSWSDGFPGGFGAYSPQHFWLSTNIFSIFIKFLLPFLNHQMVIYGVILALSFLLVYLIIVELLTRRKCWDSFLASIIGGTFFISSPLIYSLLWHHPTGKFYGIIFYPLLFLFFLRAIRKKNISELVWGGLLSVFFSVSLYSFPYSLPFAIASFVFFLLYFFIIETNKKNFIKYLFIYLFLIIFLNSFWLIPFFNSSFQENPQVSFSLSSAGKEGAVRVIESFSARTSLLKHLSGISGFAFINVKGFLGKVFEYSFKIIHLGILFFVIILLGFLVKSKEFVKEKKILGVSTVAFLCTAFLITVDIGNWGTGLFTWLMRNIPGFVAIRNFWVYPVMAYGLFYSVTLGLACYLIFKSINKRVLKIVLICLIFVVIIFQSIPFISGRVDNLPIRYPEKDAQINRKVNFPSSYLEMISYMKNLEEDIKILNFPLIRGTWSIILNDNKKGVYIGSNPAKIFTGKSSFGSDSGFRYGLIPGFNNIIKFAFENNDYQLLKNIFGLLNIKYLVYDSQIYDEHAYDFDQIRKEYVWIYKYDGKQRYQQLIDNLPVKIEKTFGQWQIYKFNDDYFLPHIYSAQKLNYIRGNINSFVKLISSDDYNLRDGILFMDSAKNLTEPIQTPQLGYKQINPTKYIVNVHGANESFPLIFSESFHSGWKIYVKPELAGKGSGQFTSEENQGTIQNQNIDGGRFYDLLFKKPVLDDKHLLINGYANSWWVDITELEKLGKVKKNKDGFYDFSVNIEFEPQKYFYLGLIISATTLFFCLSYLCFSFWKRRREDRSGEEKEGIIIKKLVIK